MFRSIVLLTGLLFSSLVFSQTATLSYWKKRQPFLKFTTAAQGVYVSNCSSPVTVQAQTAWATSPNLAAPLSINLSGTGFTYYADSNCATPITTVTIPSGSNSASFYFVPSSIGSIVLTASATNYKDATQTEVLTANPYVWTGLGGNSNWNTGANWSGGAVPGSSNQAIFNNVCAINCSPSLTANASVSAVRMLSGYSGTITQNSFTMAVGTTGWYQEAGTFTGGSNTFSITGAFTINGGTFSASTTANTFTANISVVAGTFSPGAAPFTITGRGTFNTGSTVFQDVIFSPPNGIFHYVNGTLYVNGNLTLSNTTNNCYLNNGTIDVKGNVNVLNYGLSGTTEIKLSGTGTQTIDASTASASRNLPAVTIASSGPVNLLGNLYLTSNYLYTSSGTFNAGTSLVMFVPTNTGVTANLGPGPYYDVGWNSNQGLVISTDVTVTHKFTINALLANAGYIAGPGKVYLKGDLYLDNFGGGQYSNLPVVLSGNTNQTVFILNAGVKTPSFEINSTGGTVTFPATVTFNDNFKYVQGTVAGLTTANFVGHGGSVNTIESGSYMFGEVFFTNGASGASYTIVGSMNIGGNVSFSDGMYNSVIGNINLYGNLYYSSMYNYRVGMTFLGSANQTVDGVSENDSGVWFNVNKTGGTIKLLGTLNCYNAFFTLTTGNFDMNGFSLTVNSIPSLNGNTLTKNGGVLKVGSTTVGTGALYGGTVAP